MREVALANTSVADNLTSPTRPARSSSSSTSPAPSHSPHVYGPHIPTPTFPTPEQSLVESNEDLYRRIRVQQESRYFTESNCREEGNHTSPSGSSAATVFTSEPSSSESSGLVSSPPEGLSEDHRSGAAGDDAYDSQATESAPEDDTSGRGDVEEE
ncbi:hypothetical protein BDP81DRAFT_391969 [Colletotrichum phormii]|uniref:Uncharacterized protein n=1 Tax=Colletotrichum phormii TaxID=359342 RepID=A0AAI9ZZT7_9PEZI|nr:uncharacterized protein BDP81DRAFT_391969 [Colletotrichum phormii]KAK1639933.1 hypothetical protein BDP81DRAFT_391969 [Colletotrichum phormii]